MDSFAPPFAERASSLDFPSLASSTSNHLPDNATSRSLEEDPLTTFTLGTRNSRLAMVQTKIVQAALTRAYPDFRFKIHGMTTAGDRNLSTPLYVMGGKELWTKDLEVALLEGGVDMVVHSLKDMPTVLPDGCSIGAIMEREDPRDALVVREGLEYESLDGMPEGSVIGTSSVRRVAQLRRRYPHLAFQDIRGNLNTRFAKLDAPNSPYTALILAAAGLHRLAFTSRVTAYLSPPTLYHAIGQGALGIEICLPLPSHPPSSSISSDVWKERQKRTQMVREMVMTLEHWETSWRCEAERALLRILEGGCSVPVGTLTALTPLPSGPSPHPSCPVGKRARLTLTGVVTSLDGTKEFVVERTKEGVESAEDARELGKDVAKELWANGAEVVLEELGRFKQNAGIAKTEDADPEKTKVVKAKTESNIVKPVGA